MRSINTSRSMEFFATCETALRTRVSAGPQEKSGEGLPYAPCVGGCLFCQIAGRELAAAVVVETEHVMAFLDHRPVFPGHCLLVPKRHVETFAELPEELVQPFFSAGQRLARAVEEAMEAEGTFV